MTPGMRERGSGRRGVGPDSAVGERNRRCAAAEVREICTEALCSPTTVNAHCATAHNKNKKIGPKKNGTFRTVEPRYLQSTAKRPAAKGFLKPSAPKACLEKAKTSTPEKEEYPSLSSIDLSVISMDCSIKSQLGKKAKGQQNGQKKNLSTISEKQKNSAVQNELEKLFSEYLETMYVKAASSIERKKEKTKIEHCLVNLQGRLMSRQFELQDLQKKLQTLSVNSEIELLRTLNTPDYGNILEQMTAENYEEHIDRINKKLEGSHDTLLLQNIQAPQNGGSQLQRAINETLESLQKLQEPCDSDEYETKIKSIELEEVCCENLKRCAEKISQTDHLALFNNSLKIDSDKIDSIPNPFLS